HFVTARVGCCLHKSSRLPLNASLNTPFKDDENNLMINHDKHQESFGHFVGAAHDACGAFKSQRVANDQKAAQSS
ncbi:hypothetical protein, partial [Bradyrhizobium sp. Leo121]